MLEMQAQIELLQGVVVFLSVSTIPPDALDSFIERLGVPGQFKFPETTHSGEKAISRFLDLLHKHRSVGED